MGAIKQVRVTITVGTNSVGEAINGIGMIKATGLVAEGAGDSVGVIVAVGGSGERVGRTVGRIKVGVLLITGLSTGDRGEGDGSDVLVGTDNVTLVLAMEF